MKHGGYLYKHTDTGQPAIRLPRCLTTWCHGASSNPCSNQECQWLQSPCSTVAVMLAERFNRPVRISCVTGPEPAAVSFNYCA